MRQNWTKIVRAVWMITTAALLSSCGHGLSEGFFRGPVEVGFYAGGGEQTRTEMLSNGLSAVWEDGDKLAVWAEDENGSYVLENQTFQVYGSDSGLGLFTSVLTTPMPDGNYTYYCCYPQPLSYSGTNVTFRIPSVQDGAASDGTDIMIAAPKVHKALTDIPAEGDDHSHLSLAMNRMMHHFRFYVPSDNTVLGDEKIEKIIVDFPGDVAGKITFDMADPSAAHALSDPEKEVKLVLADPLSVSPAGSPQYAYMTLAPVTVEAGQVINLKAYTDDRIVELEPIVLSDDRTFAAGHSTAVLLKVKSLKEYPYSITFNVAANNLGEDVDLISIAAPAGCAWNEGGNTVYTYKPQSGKIKAGDTFSIMFEDESMYRAFSGKSLNVTYDSENTITGQTVVVANLAQTDKVTVNLTVPYLLEQNFSSIPAYSDGHDSPRTGLASDTWVGMGNMSSCGMADWNAARVGVKANTALRICCRYQNVLGGKAYYKGQLYAPAISAIKDGKFVNVDVTFRYGGHSSNTSRAKPIMFFGINTLNPLANPDDADLLSGVVNGAGYGNQKPATLTPLLVEKELKTSGEYAFEGTMTVTIEGLDNFMRMAWFVSSTHTASNTNSNSWLYLDDITVKIANN